MNMFKTAASVATKYGKKGLRFLDDKAPEFCLALTIGHTLLTGYLTYKAYKKTREKLEEVEKEAEHPIDTVDKVKLTWKYWIPPFAACTTAITSSIIGYKIQTKRSAKLLTAYTLLEASNQATKDKMNELLGEDKASKVLDGVAEDRIQYAIDHDLVEETGTGKQIWFDAYTGHVFRSSKNNIEAARNSVNSDMNSWDTATLESFYEYMNLDGQWRFAQRYGWDKNVSKELVIQLRGSERLLPDGTSYGVLDYVSEPFLLDSRYL